MAKLTPTIRHGQRKWKEHGYRLQYATGHGERLDGGKVPEPTIYSHVVLGKKRDIVEGVAVREGDTRQGNPIGVHHTVSPTRQIL